MPESVDVGDWPSWFTTADVASYEQVEKALEKVVAGIDPDDPFAYPDLHRLDQLSVGDLLREVGRHARGAARKELVHLSLSDGSIERTSLFAYARKIAVGGGSGSYDVEEWENLRVAEGSATVARRMAAGLSDVRLARRSPRSPSAPRVRGDHAMSGEVLRAEAVVLAVPSGPARDLAITGVSDERLTSLRRQRHAWAAKFVAAYDRPFWREHRAERAVGERGRARLHLAAAARACCRPWCRPSATPPSSPATPRPATREALAQIAAMYGDARPQPDCRPGPGCGAPTRGPRATSPAGDPATSRPSGRCTAPTSRRSTCAAPTSGSPATWRAPSAPDGRRPRRSTGTRRPSLIETDIGQEVR